MEDLLTCQLPYEGLSNQCIVQGSVSSSIWSLPSQPYRDSALNLFTFKEFHLSFATSCYISIWYHLNGKQWWGIMYLFHSVPFYYKLTELNRNLCLNPFCQAWAIVRICLYPGSFKVRGNRIHICYIRICQNQRIPSWNWTSRPWKGK